MVKRGLFSFGLRLTGLLLTLCLNLTLSFTQAQSEELPPQIIRIGYTPSKGYLIEQPDNKLYGLVYDYTEALSSYNNMRIIYTPCRQDECYTLLQQEKLDLIANVPAVNDDDDPLLSFSRRAISSTVINLSRHPNHTEHFVFDSAYHYGFHENTLSRRIINEAMTNQDLEEGAEYTLSPYTSFEQMLEDYHDHRIDGVIFDSSQSTTDLSVTSQLLRVNTYYAAKKGHDFYLNMLDEAADKLILAVPSFREKLFEQHLREVTPLILTEQEKLYLSNKQYFKILVSANQAPFSYFDRNGEHQGVLHQVLKLFERDLNIHFIYQQTEDYADLLRQAQHNDADLVADFNYDFNWAKENNLRLSVPYLSADYVAVQKQKTKIPDTPRIALVEGFHYSEYIKNNLPYSEIIDCKDIHDCLEAVYKGRADVTYMQALNARHAIEEGQFYSLYTTGQIIFSHGIAMALPKRSSSMLIEIINKEVAHLRSQELLSMQIASGFYKPIRHSIKRVMYENKLVTVLISVLLAAICIGFFIYFIRQQRLLARKAWHVLHYDTVTGTPNLMFFQEKFIKFMQRLPKLQGADFYILSVNSKQFDLLRDSIDDEHLIGGVAEVLTEMEQEGPFLKFFGFDSQRQIIHCLCQIPTNMSFDELAEMFRSRLSAFSYAGYNLHLNPHIGACKVDFEYRATELISYADITLREAILHNKPNLLYEKNQFKNVILYEKIEHLINKALCNHEFEILLQPKYDLRTQKCVGAEALVRWNSPELGRMTPGQFIEILENNGLILELDYYMLDSVSRLYAEWISEHKPLVTVSINQSGLHLSEEGYLDKVHMIAAKYNLPKKSIELEITETAFVNYTTKSTRDEAQEIIDKLHELGYTISVDDFCTGYSSISMLQSLNIDTLKIDRAVLVEAQKSQRAASVLKNVVRLGADLQCHVICEGIETVEDEKLLMANGCNYGQGYLFGKPMSISKFEEFLKVHC